jgi:hypothetical protein
VKGGVEDARNELFEAVANLKSFRFRLLGVASTLPAETAWKEIIECVLMDAVEPAIRDLTTAAELLAERDEGHLPDHVAG